MKIIQGFKVHSFMLATALFAGLSLIPHAGAQERSYLVDLNAKTISDLGTLGGSNTKAYGINNSGQVVGYSLTADGVRHAFITGPDGVGMRLLGTPDKSDSFASGVNDSGQVVGGYRSTVLRIRSSLAVTASASLTSIPWLTCRPVLFSPGP